jgi:hypothetical protein
MMKPGRYRHYKGNDYEVLGVARHSETEEEYVVYRQLYGAGGTVDQTAGHVSRIGDHRRDRRPSIPTARGRSSVRTSRPVPDDARLASITLHTIALSIRNRRPLLRNSDPAVIIHIPLHASPFKHPLPLGTIHSFCRQAGWGLQELAPTSSPTRSARDAIRNSGSDPPAHRARPPQQAP